MQSQRKLRSSCDECGAAKVKCHRGQPECARCILHGYVCVYGVSMKMGKPPSDKSRAAAGARSRDQSSSCSTLSDGAVLDGAAAGSLAPPSTAASSHAQSRNMSISDQSYVLHSAGGLSSSWDPMDPVESDAENHHAGVDIPMLEGFLADMPDPSSAHHDLYASDWPSFEALHSDMRFGTQNHLAGNFPASNVFEDSYSPPVARSDSGLSYRDHDCLREAYDIAGGLFSPASRPCSSSPRDHSCHSSSSSSSSSSSPSQTHTSSRKSVSDSSLSLDEVLRMNRNAAERLGPLLRCPCAKTPHQLLLYTVILSSILTRYQQATCPSAPDTPPVGGGTSAASHEPPINTSQNASSHTLPQATTLSGASSGDDNGALSAKVVFGTFSVDDDRVQAALKLQLLSGELRRASVLIEQFRLLNNTADSLDCVGGMYYSLRMWLTGEHARISNLIRWKLRVLNP